MPGLDAVAENKPQNALSFVFPWRGPLIMTRFMLALLLLTNPVLAQSNSEARHLGKPQMQTSA